VREVSEAMTPMNPTHALLALLLPLAALAQQPGSGPPSVRTGDKGFTLESADGDFKLRLGALLQADGRFFLADDAEAVGDTLLLRRARPLLEGTVFDHYDFRLLPDFAGGSARIQDAYVDVHPHRALRLRVGRFKVPVGLEALQSDAFLPFAERALPSNLVPSRDVGVQLHGELQGGLLSYALGVFNGAVDGGSSDGDDEDGKDAAARLFVHPLRPLGVAALENLGLGVGLSYGRTGGEGGLPVYRTSGLQPFFRYRTGPADGASAAGERFRIAPQAYWYLGPLGLLGEYVRSAQDVGSAAGLAPVQLVHEAWAGTGSFVLYGGRAAYDGVKPRTPFRPSQGEWGALELALRYSELHLDPDTFPRFASPASAAREAQAFGAALNAYFNTFTRLTAHLERTTFEGGAPGGADLEDELLLIGRLQLNF
jgi:phosphate-selective porin OprO and OprP